MEFTREPVAPDFSVHKDDGRAAFAPQFSCEGRGLFARRHNTRLVCDRRRRAAARTHLDERRIGRQFIRKPHHLFRHRRRKQHGLAVGRGGHHLGDAAHVGPEAHVHHAVRLVEHKHFHVGEVAHIAPHVVQQPSGRGDDDVDAGFEGALLGLHGNAAVDRDARDGRVIREALNLVVNLRGKFARGREDQRANGVVRIRVARGHQLDQDGEKIRGRLARAGFRAADDASACQGVRQHRALNRRGLHEAALRQCVEYGRLGNERCEGNWCGVKRLRDARRRRGLDGACGTVGRARAAASPSTASPAPLWSGSF